MRSKTKPHRSVEKVIEDLLDELKKHNPKRVILFGSRAKETCNRHSDIDIAVDLNLPFRERRKLKEKLNQIAGIYTIDLVFLPLVEENFKQIILKEGKVLYEKE